MIKDNRLLPEMLYLNNYGYNQLIARIVRKVNEFRDIMTLTRLKIEIKKRLENEKDSTYYVIWLYFQIKFEFFFIFQ